MRRLIICADKEYGKRLAAYLRRELQPDYRISVFSEYRAFLKTLNEQEEADLYLLTYDFRNELLRQGAELPDPVLYLSKTRKEGEFFMWEHPGELVFMIKNQFHHTEDPDRNQTASSTSIIGVYSPFSPHNLMEYIWQEIPIGGLYLGFEDFSCTMDEDSLSQELYYYIHLRDRELFSRLRYLLPQRDGIFYLNSPRFPFDLKGLTESDYSWFIQGLRESGQFGSIYLAFGNAAAVGVNFFAMFDRMIIMDWKENDSYHTYSGRILSMIKDLELIHEGRLTSRSF